jgi:hypothetical protein
MVSVTSGYTPKGSTQIPRSGSTVVLLRLRGLARSEEGLLQSYMPEFLTGEKVLLVATGEVEAGVDLNEVESDDVHLRAIG